MLVEATVQGRRQPTTCVPLFLVGKIRRDKRVEEVENRRQGKLRKREGESSKSQKANKGKDERERERRKGIGKRKIDKREADSKARASWVVEVGEQSEGQNRGEGKQTFGVEIVGAPWTGMIKKKMADHATLFCSMSMRSKQHAIPGSVKNMFEISMILISLSIHGDMPCKFSLTGNTITG